MAIIRFCPYQIRFHYTQAGPILPKSPTEGPTYQPLHGRRMTPNQANPHDDTLHTPGMRPNASPERHYI